jgi:TonB family protein
MNLRTVGEVSMLSHFTRTICVVTLLCGMSGAGPRAASEQEPTIRKVTHRVTPLYPPVALKAGLKGTVKMELMIGPEGTVKSVRTIGGNPIFVPAAEAAVKRWKFEPAGADTSEVIAVKFDNTVR